MLRCVDIVEVLPNETGTEDGSTSYDLLARESWGASDGSDAETNPEELSVPAVQPKTSKRKEKRRLRSPRVYPCWVCEQSFNCPKERRVHKSTHHATVGESSSTTVQSPDLNLEKPAPRTTKRKPRTKKVINEDDSSRVVTQPTTPFVEVFVQGGENETKLKREGDDEVVALQENGPVVKGEKDTEDEPIGEDEANPMTKCFCTKCQEVFFSQNTLQRHIRTAHKKVKGLSLIHMCGTCKEQFSTDILLQAHYKIHPLECTRCGKYFYRRQNLNLHIKRHLGIKPFKCGICDKSFVTKQKLVEHTNSHTGNAPLKCPLCEETFRRYSNLIQHKNCYHFKIKRKVKDFICKCGDIFHSVRKLAWHMEIHDEKPKSCSYCSERFVHVASLTRHVRKAHDQRYMPKAGREEENVECPICSCIFLKASLQLHMRTHNGERPFPCHICGKDFTTKWNLQSHRWTHAARSSKPFKCSLCKSAFFRRSDYTAHMHSHRNVKPYTCNYCGCQFIRKYNCLRHVKEHQAAKSFSCNVCGKIFHRSYYLREHMRVHTGARPFACHICGKASSTKSNHNKHIKIHHAREAVNTEG